MVLDLDGTLISSFTPRRAPSLPPGCQSYIVGKGGKLNPNGVLVVERPDLGVFLQKIRDLAGKFASTDAFPLNSHMSTFGLRC